MSSSASKISFFKGLVLVLVSASMIWGRSTSLPNEIVQHPSISEGKSLAVTLEGADSFYQGEFKELSRFDQFLTAAIPFLGFVDSEMEAIFAEEPEKSVQIQLPKFLGEEMIYQGGGERLKLRMLDERAFKSFEQNGSVYYVGNEGVGFSYMFDQEARTHKEWIYLLEKTQKKYEFRWELIDAEAFQVRKNADESFSVIPQGKDERSAFVIPPVFGVDNVGNEFRDFLELTYADGIFHLSFQADDSLIFPVAIDPSLVLPVGPPVVNEIDVENDSIITVEFDSAPTLIDATTFVVSDLLGTVSGSYNLVGNVATFTHSRNFEYGSEVHVTLTTGTGLLTPYVYSFVVDSGYGTGVFTQHISSPFASTGFNVEELAVGDFNGDGFLDTLSLNTSSNNYSLSFGDGSGILTFDSNYGVTNAPLGIATADFNDDGFLDVVAVGGTQDLVVHAGDGDAADIPNSDFGYFNYLTDFTTGGSSNPTDVLAQDFDGDGDMDLAVVLFGNNSVGIYLNDGSGIFTPHPSSPFATGASGVYGLDAGDVDKDGDLDIAVASQSDQKVTILSNNGSASFIATADYLSGAGGLSFTRSVILQDFDGDEDVDIALVHLSPGSISIFSNDGLGAFTYVNNYATGSFPRKIQFVDLNNDGDLDLATADELSNRVTLLSNNGTGDFSSTTTLTGLTSAKSLFFADLDGDTGVDLIVGKAGADLNVFLNTVPPPVVQSTTPVAHAQNVAVNSTISVTFDIAPSTIDATTFLVFDRGGLVPGSRSLVGNVATFTPSRNFFVGDEVSVTLTTGTGLSSAYTFGFRIGSPAGLGIFTSSSLSVIEEVTDVYAGDLDGDGDLDLATANYGDGLVPIYISTYFGNGDGTFGAATNTVVAAKPNNVKGGDLDNDGDIDLVFSLLGSGVDVTLNNGSGVFAAPTNYSTTGWPYDLELEDLNGDGFLDIAVVNSSQTGANQKTVVIFINNGSGGFAAGVAYPYVGTDAQYLAAGDFDEDGDIDLVTANGSTNDVSVLLNNGNGTYGVSTEYAVGANARSVSVGDFDEDGNLDLVVSALFSDSMHVLLGDGNGGFGAPSSIVVPSPRGEYVGDFNADGNIDVAVANQNANSFTLLLGDGLGGLTVSSTTFGGTLPHNMHGGDLNGDGALDLLRTNFTSETVSVFLNNLPLELQSITPAENAVDISRSSAIDLVFSDPIDGLTATANTIRISGSQSGDIGGVYALQTTNETNDTVRFTPSSDYAVGESIIVSVTTGVESSVGVPLDEFFVSSFTVEVPLSYNSFVQLSSFDSQGDNPNGTALGDFNNDGIVDLIVANSGPVNSIEENVAIFSGNNDGTFTFETRYQAQYNSRPDEIFVADFNHDGNLDFVDNGGNVGDVVVYFGDGNFQFTSLVIGNASYKRGAPLADLNGDGHVDVIWGDYGGLVKSALNNGDGTFQPSVSTALSTNSSVQDVAVGDFNGDVYPDLITISVFETDFNFYAGNGDGTFDAPQIIASPFTGAYIRLQAQDFNLDGMLDIAVVSPTDVGIFLGNGAGSLTFSESHILTPASYVSFTTGDMDADGDIDLVFTGSNVIRILQNDGTGDFGGFSDYSYTENFSSLSLGDINNDLRLDIVGAFYFPSYSVGVLLNLPNTSISGSCKQRDGTTNCADGLTVKVAVNGVLQPITGTTSSGLWSINGVSFSTGDVFAVFLDGVAEDQESLAITKYDGSGSVTNVRLVGSQLSIGSDDNAIISNADLALYDNSASADEDIFFDVDANNDLNTDAEGGHDEELLILTNNTFRPDSANSGNVSTHDLQIDGTFQTDANYITVSGSWDNNGSYTTGNISSTVEFTSTASETIDNTGASASAFQNLIFNGSGGQWTILSTLTANGDVTLEAGTVTSDQNFSLNGGNLLCGGLSCGTFLMTSPSAVIISNSGAIGGSTGGSFTFYTLRLNSGTTTFQSDVTVTNTLEIGLAAQAKTLDLNTHDKNLTIGVDLIIDSQGILEASNSGSLQVGRNWTNNGTFNANGGTVTFNTAQQSTITGANTWNNLTVTTGNKVLLFQQGVTQTVLGLLTITGTSGNEITIDSTLNGSQWIIDHQGTESVQYVTVQDSGCDPGSTIITTSDATDDGNNDSCWLFDADQDGVADSVDNCPNDANAGQENNDGDGLGDVCDPDDDNDGVLDGSDADPFDAFICSDTDGDTCNDCAVTGTQTPNNDGTDTDSDGACDAGDTDDDNDGVLDGSDADPLDPFVCTDSDADSCNDCAVTGTQTPGNDGTDTDSDGLCNVGDTDDDGDGIPDGSDPDPLDNSTCGDSDSDTCDDCSVTNSSTPNNDGTDTDTDGLCDAGDTDDDGDGVADGSDADPLNAFVCADSDSDSCDDCSVTGMQTPANDGTDTDADGQCNVGDGDDDGDGTADGLDCQPLNGAVHPGATEVCTDTIDNDCDADVDLDDADCATFDGDNDGIPDINDPAPNDAFVCGDNDSDTCDDCSVAGSSQTNNDGTDTDSDGACDAGDNDDDDDGVPDGSDPAPLNAFVCSDTDSDTCDDCAVTGTQTPNNDGTDTDTDGQCNIGDGDDDGDGIPDGSDADPLDAFACSDTDGDSCDDCAVTGTQTPNNDGTDTDTDGQCDAGDMDDDGDGVPDGSDTDPLNANSCSDIDADSCNDCVIAGTQSPNNDGTDTDVDGLCDAGDTDDDGDGVADVSDTDPLNAFICADSDSDTCDDCSVTGTQTPANDGTDGDSDGLCDAGDADDDNDGDPDVNDCQPMNPAISTLAAEVCNDSIDNDCDGDIDLADAGCTSFDGDSDGVPDINDPAPADNFICGDSDSDTCDDCSVAGTSQASNDGTDTELDGLCDAGDLDDDNDGVPDAQDSDPLDPFVCRNVDGDSCDDCSSGVDNSSNDGCGGRRRQSAPDEEVSLSSSGSGTSFPSSGTGVSQPGVSGSSSSDYSSAPEVSDPELSPQERLQQLVIHLESLFQWMSPDDYQLLSSLDSLVGLRNEHLLRRETVMLIGESQLDAVSEYRELITGDLDEPVENVAELAKLLFLSLDGLCLSTEEIRGAVKFDSPENPFWFAGYLYYFDELFQQILGTTYVPWEDIKEIPFFGLLSTFITETCLDESNGEVPILHGTSEYTEAFPSFSLDDQGRFVFTRERLSRLSDALHRLRTPVHSYEGLQDPIFDLHLADPQIIDLLSQWGQGSRSLRGVPATSKASISTLAELAKVWMFAFGEQCYTAEQILRAARHDVSGNEWWYAGYWHFFQNLFAEVMPFASEPWTSLEELDGLAFLDRYANHYCGVSQ